MPSALLDKMLSPPQAAKLMGVDPHKVTAFIKSGDLVAFDLASPGSRRPRWRIAEDALETFLLRRQSRPAPPARKRRRQPAEVKEFY
jgi:hypothetical protein